MMWVYFFIWPILEARAEIYCFFGKFKTPKFPSEIIWTLENGKTKWEDLDKKNFELTHQQLLNIW